LSTSDNIYYPLEKYKLTEAQEQEVIESMLETLEKYYPPHDIDHIADSTVVEDQEDALVNLIVDTLLFCKLNGHSFQYLHAIADAQYRKIRNVK